MLHDLKSLSHLETDYLDRDISEMFGFKYGVPFSSDSSDIDYSGLDDIGLQDIGRKAMLLKSISRLCEMACGSWPIIDLDSLGGSGHKVIFEFAGESHSWGIYNWELNIIERKRSEPTLKLLCKLFGPIAMDALKGLACEDLIKKEFLKGWKESRSYRDKLNPDLLTKKDIWIMGRLSHMREEGLSLFFDALMSIGVPKYALGLDVVPPERWLEEDLSYMIEHCPDNVWGDWDYLREKWSEAAKVFYEGLSSERMSALYADDGSVGRSELEQCSSKEKIAKAQLAVLDLVARSRLPKDHVYALSDDQIQRNLDLISMCEKRLTGQTYFMNYCRVGVVVFEDLVESLGIDLTLLSDNKKLSEMLPSIIEAQFLRHSIEPLRSDAIKKSAKRL